MLAGCASPLGRAARDGDVASIKRLVNAGAPLDAADANAETPLMKAAQNGQVGSIAALLDAGADPNAGTRGGTPLERAALYGRLEAVKVLLAGGAKSTARAHELAVQSGYPEVALVLGAAVAPDPGDAPLPLKPGSTTLSHGNLDPDAFQRMLDSSRRSP